MILELSHIYKNYQSGSLEVPVRKDVNLTNEEGEYLAIMGPSGSGKSTLMNIVGCLDTPTSGTMILDGEDVSKLSDNAMADVRLRKLGFIFQSFQLLPYETALENVALPLTYAGVSRAERRERAAEALKRVGLEERMNFIPTQLSGGQKQRVAIARAMINRPKLLLADEPTGALDQASGRQVMELFESLNEEGVTVMMITHDANVAKRARRIVEIWDGELYLPGEAHHE
ncbi:MAG: ABC transporter ATP-binding protein [Clostridia bacterium]|nr:ABC transporter ATP-binding protein [Clostridia bacterium]